MNIIKEENGSVLIITVLIIGIIVVLTLQLSKTAIMGFKDADIRSNKIKLGCIARSGINFTLASLQEDLLINNFDSLHDLWADSTQISDETASLLKRDFLN